MAAVHGPAVMGHVVDACALLRAAAAAEKADELGRGAPVPSGIVELDLAARAAEAQPGIGEDDVAVPRKCLRLGLLVVLGAAEAVRRQDRRRGMTARRRAR